MTVTDQIYEARSNYYKKFRRMPTVIYIPPNLIFELLCSEFLYKEQRVGLGTILGMTVKTSNYKEINFRG